MYVLNSIYKSQSNLGVKLKKYAGICKGKVVMMLVLTAFVGLALAPDMQRHWFEQVMSLLGIGLLSAAAAAINHVVDREIDKKMVRTQHRPIAMEQLSISDALLFAASLSLIGLFLLVYFSNVLCAVLTLAALVGYAVIYTLFLKRATPQNIVIGGLAGAMPPLLGWVSETGQLSTEPWLLVMIIFTWTPPHFWALAIARKDDYLKAKIPMLPVTHGEKFTKLCVLGYSIILFLVCLLPYLIGMSGTVYLITACVLNSVFTVKAWLLYKGETNDRAMPLFQFSITYLLLLFGMIFIDQWVF